MRRTKQYHSLKQARNLHVHLLRTSRLMAVVARSIFNLTSLLSLNRRKAELSGEIMLLIQPMNEEALWLLTNHQKAGQEHRPVTEEVSRKNLCAQLRLNNKC